MIMADNESISLICTEVFMSHKRDAASHRNAKLEAKLAALVENHRCFKEENIVHQPQNTVSTNNWTQNQHNNNKANPQHRNHTNSRGNGRHPHGHGHGHGHTRRPLGVHLSSSSSSVRKAFIGLGTDKVIREATSILNKVSTKNINGMMTRYMLICKENTDFIDRLIQAVIDKSVNQECFAVLFMRMLTSLCHDYEEAVKRACVDFVERFSEDLEKDLESLVELDEDKGYDIMCDFFKGKSRLLSKNKCIMRLMKARIIEGDIVSHGRFLIEKLEKCGTNPTKLAVLSKAVSDALPCIGPGLDMGMRKQLSAIYKTIIKPSCGMNTQFMWVEMLENSRLK